MTIRTAISREGAPYNDHRVSIRASVTIRTLAEASGFAGEPSHFSDLTINECFLDGVEVPVSELDQLPDDVVSAIKEKAFGR